MLHYDVLLDLRDGEHSYPIHDTVEAFNLRDAEIFAEDIAANQFGESTYQNDKESGWWMEKYGTRAVRVDSITLVPGPSDLSNTIALIRELGVDRFEKWIKCNHVHSENLDLLAMQAVAHLDNVQDSLECECNGVQPPCFVCRL